MEITCHQMLSSVRMKTFVPKIQKLVWDSIECYSRDPISVSLKTRAPEQQFRTALSQSYKPTTTSPSLCPAQHISHTPSPHSIIRPTKFPVSQHSKMLRRENQCKTKYLHRPMLVLASRIKHQEHITHPQHQENKVNNRTPAIRSFPPKEEEE